MTTIRIYVEDAGPLDGVSPLHPEAKSSWNAQLGLREIWVPAGVPLGRLHLRALAPGSEHAIEHLTVLSASGRHAPGAFVGLAGPTLPEITLDPTLPIPLVDLGACEETNTGVLTEGLGTPIPADHALVLDTRVNGAAPGPHLIQITLGPVPRFLQGALPPLRPFVPEEVEGPEEVETPTKTEAPSDEESVDDKKQTAIERIAAAVALPAPESEDETTS